MEDKILQKLPGIQRNILLKDYTTYKIGGPAKYFFIAKAKEDLIIALKAANEFNLPVFILGGGSNLLVSDNGFLGLIIKMNISGVKFKGSEAVIGDGYNLTKLAGLSAKNGLSGLEWAFGIPGATVGGAIYGHAQAFGAKISDLVESVEAINLKTFKSKIFTKKQCQFSLKNSIFKKNKNWVIVSAILKFSKRDKKKIRERINNFSAYRKKGHPMSFSSAGSTFVNTEKKITNKKLLEKFPALKEFNKRGVIPSGYLIEEAGLMGKRIGNAKISEKHANFIVNLGGAKAEDVFKLINLAKKKVKETFGVLLETEVQLVGFKK